MDNTVINSSRAAPPFPPEVASWANRRVIVLVDADQFFHPKHMQRCADLPPSFELRFFSCSVYPSGARKPTLRHVDDFCAHATDHIAYHESTEDPTIDADDLMVFRARELHAAEPSDVNFLYVTNDRLLSKKLANILSSRTAVHWKHLHIPKGKQSVA